MLDSSDMNDLDYRRQQLEQLQKAAPTMEDLAGGLSITDLTLSDFRMDAASRPRAERSSGSNEWRARRLSVVPCESHSTRHSSQTGLSQGPSSSFASGTMRLAFRRRTHLLPTCSPSFETMERSPTQIEEPKLALDVLRRHALDRTEADDAAIASFEAATARGGDMNHYRSPVEHRGGGCLGSRRTDARGLYFLGRSVPCWALMRRRLGLQSVDVVAWMAIVP